MNLDDILHRTFGTSDLAAIPPEALAAGSERLAVDLALETDPDRRFALWSILYILGCPPELESAFPDPAEREAARNLMDLMAASGAG